MMMSVDEEDVRRTLGDRPPAPPSLHPAPPTGAGPCVSTSLPGIHTLEAGRAVCFLFFFTKRNETNRHDQPPIQPQRQTPSPCKPMQLRMPVMHRPRTVLQAEPAMRGLRQCSRQRQAQSCGVWSGRCLAAGGGWCDGHVRCAVFPPDDHTPLPNASSLLHVLFGRRGGAPTLCRITKSPDSTSGDVPVSGVVQHRS